MAISEAEKLAIQLASAGLSHTASVWESLYKQVSEELERVKKERDILARKAARWDAFSRLVQASNFEEGVVFEDSPEC